MAETSTTHSDQHADRTRWEDRYGADYPDLIEREQAYNEYLEQRAVMRRVFGE